MTSWMLCKDKMTLQIIHILFEIGSEEVLRKNTLNSVHIFKIGTSFIILVMLAVEYFISTPAVYNNDLRLYLPKVSCESCAKVLTLFLLLGIKSGHYNHISTFKPKYKGGTAHFRI